MSFTCVLIHNSLPYPLSLFDAGNKIFLPLLSADSHLGFLPTEWSEEKGRVVPLSPLLLSLLDDVRQGLGGPGAQLVENVLEALLLLQPNRYQ